MKRWLFLLLLASLSLVSFAQKIDTTTTYQWDTLNHQFVNNAQQIFKYNGACYLTLYTYNFWDSTTGKYNKYYKSTNSLLANNAISQTLNQIWDDVANKWVNYQKVNYTYTTNPSIPSSVIYQSWQTSNSSFVNSRQYFYTYDNNLNNTITLIQDWNSTSTTWKNIYQYTYTYNPNNQISSFLQQNWINNVWVNDNQINYLYNNLHKSLIDSGNKWYANSSTWVPSFRNRYYYNNTNLLDSSIYDVWDTLSKQLLYNQKYIYTINNTGNIEETLTLSWDTLNLRWDTLFKDVNHYNGCTLPVELVDFEIQKSNNKIKLNWQTTNEVNISHYNIQRASNLSSEFNSFITIGSLKSLDNISNKYFFEDELKNINYNNIFYRLEIIELDGSIKYSNIKKVLISTLIDQYKIYPNPATNYINVIGDGISKVNIKDITGRILYTKNIYHSSPNQISLKTFTQGIYFLEILQIDGTINVEKILIK